MNRTTSLSSTGVFLIILLVEGELKHIIHKTCTHTCTYTYTHARTCACAGTRAHTHTHTLIHYIHMFHGCKSVIVHLGVFVCACVCVCVCVHMYVYIVYVRIICVICTSQSHNIHTYINSLAFVPDTSIVHNICLVALVM